MMRVFCARPLVRSSQHTSRPSPSGRLISIRMRSKVSSEQRCSALTPSRATQALGSDAPVPLRCRRTCPHTRADETLRSFAIDSADSQSEHLSVSFIGICREDALR
jgi:hypothetical protein